MQVPTLIDGRTEVRLGDRFDYVDIRVIDGILMIDVVGAPESAKIHQAMQEGHKAGWIRTEMPTLVDVSDFHGRIDWSAIKALSQMADWGSKTGTPSRVAYLSADPFFALVVKAVSILFPRSTHRLFADRRAALRWLQADPLN
jgi:hypothetical protein